MNRRVLRWATTSARVVIGTAVAVTGVIAITAAIAAPWPQLTTEPVRVEATPAPADTVLACDGPVLALGRLVEQAGELSIAASQVVVSGPSTTVSEQSALTAPAGSAPVALSAAPTAGERAVLAASGAASVEAVDLRGFAASACRPPLMESWLVGGATTTGSGDLVLLSNPGDVAATVQLTVYGASGVLAPTGGVDRVVPAGAQIVIPLAGLVTNEASPVVHVTASGSPVVAALQSSIIRTLVPGGLDQFGATAAASDRQVLAGVPVTASPVETGAVSTLVRMLAPASDTQARVRVLAADGSAAAAEVTVPLVAGVPSELDLGALATGRYTIVVDADQPLVAGAWAATGFAAGSDFVWMAAAPEIVTPTTFAVPQGAGATLTLVNPGDGEVTATLSDPSGTDQAIALPGGAVREIALVAGIHRIDPRGAIEAAVSFSAPGAVAGFPVWGADAAAQPIVVYP